MPDRRASGRLWVVRLLDAEGEAVAAFVTEDTAEYLETCKDLGAIGSDYATSQITNVVSRSMLDHRARQRGRR